MKRDKYKAYVLPRLQSVADWTLEGVGEKEIAERLGISKSTLSRYKKSHKELERVLNTGRGKVIAEVENALLKKAMGYSYTEVRTVDKGDRVEVTTTDKEVPPDLSAISFVLRNYCPEKWSDKPTALKEEKAAGGVVILPDVIDAEEVK